MATLSPFNKVVIFASIGFLLWLVFILSPILSPFLVGMAIAYLGDPLVDRLEGKLGRTGGVMVVFAIALTLILTGLLLLLPMLITEIKSLIRSLPRFVAQFQDTAYPILTEQFNLHPERIDAKKLEAIFLDAAKEIGNATWFLVKGITSSGLAMALALANMVLIPIVTFYLMRDWDILVLHLRSLLPRAMQADAVRLGSECDEVLSAFLRGQMLVMVVLGIIYTIGLALVGLDMSLLIGMIAGLASIVPYLGFFVGLAIATIAGFIQFDTLLPLIYIAIVFGVGQVLEGMLLTPLLVGDRIGLHPVAVIFAILAGGQLFGFSGVLLALPVAAVVMVFLRHWHGRYTESNFYCQPPALNVKPSADE